MYFELNDIVWCIEFESLSDECVMALALVQIDSCVLSLLLPLLLLLVCSLRNVREIILYKLH